MTPTKCRACGKETFWIRTKNGRMMLVDKQVTVIWDMNGHQAAGHMPHSTHCPEAVKYRRKK